MELEDKNIATKLEGIFMPHMAKGKKEVSDNGDQYVHYTSAENALKILNSKQLWLRNPTCMNDYMEISHGRQMLQDFFDNEINRDKFVSAIDSYEQGVAQEIFDGFNEWWEKIKHDTFIASISVHSKDEEQHGRLSMWRAYGSESGKAALIINNPPQESSKLKVILSPAAYFTTEELEEEMLQVIAAIDKNIDYLRTLKKETILGTVIISLIILATCLKHPGFKEEQEWRLIYLSGMFTNNNWLVRDIETINGIPQVVYKLPLENNKELEITGLSIPELIDKVLIGPTQYPLAMFDAFYETLIKLGIDDTNAKVTVSNIPLRT